MPKEQKKRGRRAEQARQKEQEADEIKFPEDVGASEQNFDSGNNESLNVAYEGMPFFGLLDEAESEYFKGADDMLKADSFETDDDRNIFIANVFKEADGKELKLANSQGCSRLLERMIGLAKPTQLKKLFQKCNGNFIHLIQHRFASHFCEKLFAQSAIIVEAETKGDAQGRGDAMEVDGEEVFASMESLFLFTLNELEPTLHTLLMHPFASHTIRVLLLVLSGKGTEITASSSLLQSRKKENQIEADILAHERYIPDSFKEAITRILTNITNQFSVRELRALCTHHVGSPTLQLLLRIELASQSHGGKKNKKQPAVGGLLGKLLSDDETGDGPAAAFLNSMVYDSIGSHVLETIVQSANDTTFATLYDLHFKGRVASLARNETASFVAQKIVERLQGEQLTAAVDEVAPIVPNLLERGLVAVIKGLLDGCNNQGANSDKLVKAIADAFSGNVPTTIFTLLKITPEELNPNNADDKSEPKKNHSTQLHASLLGQSLLQLPGTSADFIRDSLLAQPSGTLIALAEHPTASHLIQASLTSPTAPILFKRKLLNNFAGSFAQLAMNGCGSHIVDACWTATIGMNKYRQDIAEELIKSEAEVRPSYFGSKIWRNWKLDKYKTRRGEWFSLSQADGVTTAPAWAPKDTPTEGGPPKSAIQLARERKAAERVKKAEFEARKARREAAQAENRTVMTTAHNISGYAKRKQGNLEKKDENKGEKKQWIAPDDGNGRREKMRRYF